MASERMITFRDYRRMLCDYFVRPGPKSFPRSRKTRLLLLWSATRCLELGQPYDEGEIDDAILEWQERIGGPVDIDHVTIRRYLVDMGFLDRNPSGTVYAVIHSFLDEGEWDKAIFEADEESVIEEIRKQRAKDRGQHRGGRRGF